MSRRPPASRQIRSGSRICWIRTSFLAQLVSAPLRISSLVAPPDQKLEMGMRRVGLQTRCGKLVHYFGKMGVMLYQPHVLTGGK